MCRMGARNAQIALFFHSKWHLGSKMIAVLTSEMLKSLWISTQNVFLDVFWPRFAGPDAQIALYFHSKWHLASEMLLKFSLFGRARCSNRFIFPLEMTFSVPNSSFLDARDARIALFFHSKCNFRRIFEWFFVRNAPIALFFHSKCIFGRLKWASRASRFVSRTHARTHGRNEPTDA